MDLSLITFALGVILSWILYNSLTKNFEIFIERGVAFEKPVLLFGNVYRTVRGIEGLPGLASRLCRKYYNEK